MRNRTIIAVTKDAEWLIGMRPVLHGSGGNRVVVAESVEEAERLLDFAQPRMVVVDGKPEACGADAIAGLLWKNSTQGRPASVMIVADDYRIDEATLMFRLGVDEYVGGVEHRDALAAVMTALAPAAQPRRSRPVAEPTAEIAAVPTPVAAAS